MKRHSRQAPSLDECPARREGGKELVGVCGQSHCVQLCEQLLVRFLGVVRAGLGSTHDLGSPEDEGDARRAQAGDGCGCARGEF